MTYILKFSQNFLFYNSFHKYLIIIIFLYSTTAIALDTTDEILRSRILYLLKTGKEATSFDLYEKYYKEKHCHDTELLEQMSLIVLEKGFQSDIPECELLSIYGAGISTNEKMLDILKLSLTSKYPECQLIGLNFLSRLHHDEADALLMRAMNSDYLAIRLEAAFHMAEQKAPKIVGQLESLMYKVNSQLHPLFPQFFALIGTKEAIKALSKLLGHKDEKVRVAAIISAATHKRDDLLPIIQKLATHHSVMQQEACAFALGKMKDESSILKLETLKSSPLKNVQLAALLALYHLGQRTKQKDIENMAKNLDLHAISMLFEIDGSDSILLELTKHEDFSVRINASIALLKSEHPSVTPPLLEILIRDTRDLAFIEQSSLGGTLKYLKAIPSASQNFKDNGLIHEMSLKLREEILVQTLKLPENEFLGLAKIIFESQQNELIALLASLIESLGTKNAIEILKFYQQKTGAPLIRNYCNLALYHLKEKGPYEENINKFILQECKTDLIEFRPFLPFEMRSTDAQYGLTPQDRSRLLIESFEAIAANRDEASINLLLHAIEHGNSNNKYVLVGLLMHAIR